MRVAYVVSRFPHVTETFVVRELDGVDATADLDVELFSLFPATDDTLHPAARGWIARLHHGSAWGALRGLAWWLCRRPGALLGSAAIVGRAFARKPARLARALVTVAVASDHARAMRASCRSSTSTRISLTTRRWPPGPRRGWRARRTASPLTRTTSSATSRSCAG